MTMSEIDAAALLLDQIYFALDAKGFAGFEHMLDNPPAPTNCLRRTLTAAAPWDAPGAPIGNDEQEL